jgi:dTDP-4-amino-4,6-dideoxygalactose transaminase
VSNSERIPLAEPAIGGNARRYLAECIDTNFVSSVGPFVKRFEDLFAESVGSRHAVACASGTAAIHVALRVGGVGPDDLVVVPTLTFIASANPVRYLGGRVLLVDVESETMNLDPQRLVDALRERDRLGLQRPKAMEIVHLLGHPAAIDDLIEIAREFELIVVEDAAEALGASWLAGRMAGRQVGTVGSLGCFSFNGNKIITTGGGGMITTDDDDLAERARHLTTQARLPGRTYRHDEVGYNYRLSNLAAALGLAQLEDLPRLLAARRSTAARYDAAIGHVPGIQPARRASWADPSFWLYTISLEVPSAAERDRVLDDLAAAGIDARPIWTPLHLVDPYRDAERVGGDVAEDLFVRSISLPSSATLSEANQDRVIDALLGSLRDNGRTEMRRSASA